MLRESRRLRPACVAIWLAAANGCHQGKHEAPESDDDSRSGAPSGRSSRTDNAARSQDDDAGSSATAGNRSPAMSPARSPSAPRAGGAGARARDAGARETEADGGADTPAADSGMRAVTIRFKARVGLFDFACGETYRGLGTHNTTLTPEDLRFFVQDVQLTRTDGRTLPLELDVRRPWQSSELALLDFEDGTGSCGEGDSETNTALTGKVPAGEYRGISFSNGVPEPLDHADPLTLEDPLRSHPGMSWGWLDGFRFVKLELREVAGPNEAFSHAQLHVGSSACTGDVRGGSVHCDKSNRNRVVLKDFDPDRSTIVLDIARAFAATDLSETAECHAAEAACAPMFQAFGLDFGTGKALDAQAIYWAE